MAWASVSPRTIDLSIDSSASGFRRLGEMVRIRNSSDEIVAGRLDIFYSRKKKVSMKSGLSRTVTNTYRNPNLE